METLLNINLLSTPILALALLSSAGAHADTIVAQDTITTRWADAAAVPNGREEFLRRKAELLEAYSRGTVPRSQSEWELQQNGRPGLGTSTGASPGTTQPGNALISASGFALTMAATE